MGEDIDVSDVKVFYGGQIIGELRSLRIEPQIIPFATRVNGILRWSMLHHNGNAEHERLAKIYQRTKKRRIKKKLANRILNLY